MSCKLGIAMRVFPPPTTSLLLSPSSSSSRTPTPDPKSIKLRPRPAARSQNPKPQLGDAQGELPMRASKDTVFFAKLAIFSFCLGAGMEAFMCKTQFYEVRELLVDPNCSCALRGETGRRASLHQCDTASIGKHLRRSRRIASSSGVFKCHFVGNRAALETLLLDEGGPLSGESRGMRASCAGGSRGKVSTKSPPAEPEAPAGRN